MNDNAVISWRAKDLKLAFNHALVFPIFSILDPTTTLSLPTRQTANGVVDSIVHVCEQYVTFPMHADVQDRYAEALLKVLIESGKVIMENPNDLDARANIMWAATQVCFSVPSPRRRLSTSGSPRVSARIRPPT